MKRSVGAKRYNQNIINTIVLAVVLAMLLYLTIQISRGFYSKVSTQRTQTVTEYEYVYLDGCIFRDDSVVTAEGDIVYYTVQNGEKVGVGQTYAEVFSGTGLSKSECSAIQDRLNSLSAAIALLKGGLGGSSYNLGQINENISAGYYSYVDSILSGDLTSADKFGNNLLSGLVDYSAATSGDKVKDRLSILESERDKLLSSIGGTRSSLISDKSFNFFYGSDGYEDSLHVSLLDSMTCAELDSNMIKPPQNVSGAIGRATENSKWYLALPLDRASYEIFRTLVGTTFTVDFLGFDGLEISMLIENVIEDTDGGEGGYMLMSSHSLAYASSLDRLQSVRIFIDSSIGYRVPREALHEVDGVDGVYVLIGNVIEFRRVTVIGDGGDYYVVATNESDAMQSTDEITPYLSINDMIVTSGNDLYDGKQLD